MNPDDIDEATGLPRLPAGDRWFVGFAPDYDFGMSYHYVAWERKTKKMVWNWKKWRKVEVEVWERIAGEEITKSRNPTKADFLCAAQVIVKHNREAQATKALLGAYPPKSLA